MSDKWIGIDLDGTLAYYESGYVREGIIGSPILPMIEYTRSLISQGKLVKIFTARVHQSPDWVEKIQEWCIANGLPRLEVTNIKDHHMEFLIDDRAVTVEKNTGRFLTCFSEDCPMR